MWFNRQDERCLFGDMRHESIIVTDRTHREDGTRAVHIHPDVRFDFRRLPFADESFYHVVFDPPHLVRAGPRNWLAAKYGKLSTHWQDDLRAGFAECFRVLRPNCVLNFKWNETQIPVREILACTDAQPLYGHRGGRLNKTHWIVFMKESE
ncbi:class I SAM-dependent methyltransferase [Alcaligenes endophyticus]|uniref:Class I SAM-dependent methyltransferase n=1 Tax=Alcaligenes endophyticus TaxID=1929088 RepID=A0ABT8EIU6_9BURK|nr:class I SAM-dependent methyltransferase [Alcaligenes endophyticus]MCX5592481.1 class I SAM-dependent methyltransferase [Alcaligenes endophyticus]MDN4121206.1 class I SAM-dependent methyltransferase [Alcaligenes endophyticus]